MSFVKKVINFDNPNIPTKNEEKKLIKMVQENESEIKIESL